MEPNLFDQGNTPLAGKGNAKDTNQHHTRSSSSMRPPFRCNAPKGTSEIAAKMIATHAPSQRARVYRAILESGAHGLTDDEGETQLDIFAASYSPRRGELVKQSLIRETGNRRLTQRGCPAAVWVAVDHMEGSGNE
ncbi:MAG: hypothetical protein JKX70_08815 [Phycisphaerales bacterium]|nr:hypothetical protein [Phycisphaerales bacterium]